MHDGACMHSGGVGKISNVVIRFYAIAHAVSAIIELLQQHVIIWHRIVGSVINKISGNHMYMHETGYSPELHACTYMQARLECMHASTCLCVLVVTCVRI